MIFIYIMAYSNTYLKIYISITIRLCLTILFTAEGEKIVDIP